VPHDLVRGAVEGLLAFFFGVALLWFTLWLYILVPARMARSRGRSAVVWVLLSLIFSPVLAIFFLWFLGDAANGRA
jgi:hypothetical protein